MSKTIVENIDEIDKISNNSSKKEKEKNKKNSTSLEIFQNVHIPRWEELPDLDLYLDQLVTLLDTYLSPYIGDGENQIITKTMINNYVKQGAISPPKKKKYNKEHIASIFVICILKSVYSISNVADLLKLATTNFKIKYSYNKFCDIFEYSVKSIFKHNKLEFSTSISNDEILLQNVIQSVAYKIYVEKTFLNNN